MSSFTQEDSKKVFNSLIAIAEEAEKNGVDPKMFCYICMMFAIGSAFANSPNDEQALKLLERAHEDFHNCWEEITNMTIH